MKAIKHMIVVGVVDFGAIQAKVGDASPIDVANDCAVSKAACALIGGIGDLAQAINSADWPAATKSSRQRRGRVSNEGFRLGALAHQEASQVVNHLSDP